MKQVKILSHALLDQLEVIVNDTIKREELAVVEIKLIPKHETGLSGRYYAVVTYDYPKLNPLIYSRRHEELGIGVEDEDFH